MGRGSEIGDAGSRARSVLEAKHNAREATLSTSRSAIRECALGIRAVHRREFEVAGTHIEAAAALIEQARAATRDYPDIRHAGFLVDAEKELVEANLTVAYVAGVPAPTADELGVGVAAYLNGMCEAASELRRQVLDCLRRAELADAENLFEVMDEVYGLLVTIDYPDALTGGLRRSTDALRAVLERTRGDLTNAIVAARISAATDGLSGSG
ncbi:MAG: haloacid dehalogenase [Actinobacteria bacterium]|nr:MAG: haloacid dehalogenase [Actinomycetota bacterium]